MADGLRTAYGFLARRFRDSPVVHEANHLFPLTRSDESLPSSVWDSLASRTINPQYTSPMADGSQHQQVAWIETLPTVRYVPPYPGYSSTSRVPSSNNWLNQFNSSDDPFVFIEAHNACCSICLEDFEQPEQVQDLNTTNHLLEEIDCGLPLVEREASTLPLAPDDSSCPILIETQGALPWVGGFIDREARVAFPQVLVRGTPSNASVGDFRDREARVELPQVLVRGPPSNATLELRDKIQRWLTGTESFRASGVIVSFSQRLVEDPPLQVRHPPEENSQSQLLQAEGSTTRRVSSAQMPAHGITRKRYLPAEGAALNDFGRLGGSTHKPTHRDSPRQQAQENSLRYLPHPGEISARPRRIKLSRGGDFEQPNTLPPTQLLKQLPCKHIYHEACLRGLENRVCPLCRRPIR
ncbi:hypothetical protein DL96DRAFT_1824464 [Flagelloscypha sp. PMI_526]|nr:hypothetical protein DL96DRAFT_1824464 [Flagelloscypha sp. PMI_526]